MCICVCVCVCVCGACELSACVLFVPACFVRVWMNCVRPARARQVPGFNLQRAEICVFDEADRLFELGFAEQLRELVARMPEGRQTALFSATLPAVLAAFVRAGLRDPAVVRLDVDTKLSDKLKVHARGCVTSRVHFWCLCG